MNTLLLLVISFLIPSLITGYIVEESASVPTLSLYSKKDNVIELTDQNITSINTDDSIWLVEFYNHWCGHCQRFVPTWVKVAERLKNFEPVHIKVGAINCAKQNACENFQIQGTPTIRLYNPRNPQAWTQLTSDGSAQVYVSQVRDIFRTWYPEMVKSNTGRPMLYTTSPSTTTFRPKVINNPQVESEPDKVHQDDIEKAIQNSLNKEIPTKPFMNYLELRALYKYLDVLIKNTPNLRKPMRNFLISLREWPQMMGLSTITGKQFKEKVKELEMYYEPFAETGSQYVHCKGSDPKFRGYPCSLWTLFHALTVNAQSVVFQDHFGGGALNPVADAILGYVKHFFSCKDCAQHFLNGANTLAYHPHSDKDAIYWLWTLHNMANRRLADDITEDPKHPKIQWPSKKNCPQCLFERYDPYTGRLERVIQIQPLIDYMTKVYSATNIEQNELKKDSPSVEITRADCLELIPVKSRPQCRATFLP